MQANSRRKPKFDRLDVYDPGFYRSEFGQGELFDLEAMLSQGLESEINMLRVVTRRVVAMSSGVESVSDMIEILKALGTACGRMAKLLRVQQELGHDDSEVRNAISQALAEVVEEMGIHGNH